MPHFPEQRAPSHDTLEAMVFGMTTPLDRLEANQALGREFFRQSFRAYQAAVDRGDTRVIEEAEQRLDAITGAYPEVRAFVNESED